MGTKQFKAESKKLLDMMINSIYTHKEIFLRELISNASDALDKLYFRSLTDTSVGMDRSDFNILIELDKEKRLITITDNGCGMNAAELEKDLGTIAKSGTSEFRKENDGDENIDIIGQFGVGFYSAFMVSDHVTVDSLAYGETAANRWESSGVDGYTIEPSDKKTVGTVITLHIKDNTDDEKYDEFLEQYRISSLIKKYSDYIRYPIKMEMTSRQPKEDNKDEYEDVTELKTLNSMVPLWKKNKSEVSDEEYNKFYNEKFMDYEAPLDVIHFRTEGQATFSSMLFIPSHAPFDYYSKEYEKGLQLFSKGVLIMDKCADLLPDYFSFVKGLVDSEDLSLNISREVLQHDHQLRLIAKTIEKKIHAELEKLLRDDREKYEKLFTAFGMQLKFGLYADYGMHKDLLKDLVLFTSSFEDKPVTLKEYVSRMTEKQENIYYASGESIERIKMLPQADAVRDRGCEILYLTDTVDEFAIRSLAEYEGKKFMNVCDDKLDLATDEEKENLKTENESGKDMLEKMKEALGDDVTAVRFTDRLKNHPVCLTSDGDISLEMEKVLNAMPGNEKIKAKVALEINLNHPIAQKLKDMFAESPESIEKYAKLLYGQACLIGGVSVKDPAELSALMCELMI